MKVLALFFFLIEAQYFRNYLLRKTWLLKCITRPILERRLAVNVLTGPKRCRSLQESTLILPFYHSDIDRARKRFS